MALTNFSGPSGNLAAGECRPQGALRGTRHRYQTLSHICITSEVAHKTSEAKTTASEIKCFHSMDLEWQTGEQTSGSQSGSHPEPEGTGKRQDCGQHKDTKSEDKRGRSEEEQ
jgi:hypothetical protein